MERSLELSFPKTHDVDIMNNLFHMIDGYSFFNEAR